MASRDILIRFLADVANLKSGTKAAGDVLGEVETKAGSAGSKIGDFISKIPGIGPQFDKIRGNVDKAGLSTDGMAGSLLAVGAGTVVAGAAIGTFALKAVGDYEHLVLKADGFATATGNTVDQSSRWIEVADDHGVAADTVESAMGRMNKTAGLTPGVFDKYGVAIGHAKDGTVDANATFLNAIDRLGQIKDPALQAEAGVAIFGRGWQGMAALISEGAPKLRSDLASVQASKVFSDKDVKTAKDVRDGFDSIKDAGEGLILTIGKALAPAIASITPLIGDLITAVGPLVSEIGTDLAGAFTTLSPVIKGTTTVLEAFFKSVDRWKGIAKDVADDIFKVTHGDQKAFTDEQVSGSAKITGQMGLQAGALVKLSDAQKDATVSFLAGWGPQDHLTQAVDAYKNSTLQARNANVVGADAEKLSKQAVDDAAQAVKDKQDAIRHAADVEIAAHEEATKALQDNITALQNDITAHQELIDAQRAAVDSTFAVHKATADYEGADKKLSEALKAAKKDTAAQTVAFDDHTQAARDVADATSKVYEETIKASGGTETATQKIDVFNHSLVDQATSKIPGANAAIADYIIKTNQIPDEKATAIRAAIAKGDLDTAKALIDEASKTRTMSLVVDADDKSIADANRKIQQGIDKTINIKVSTQTSAGTPHAAGGMVGASEAFQIVGEDGVEVAKYPTGTQFSTASQTRRDMRAASQGGGLTFVWQQNAPIYGVDDLEATVNRALNKAAAQINAGRRR